MELVKKIIRKFLYRIYLTGFAEQQRINNLLQSNKFLNVATIHPSTIISHQSEILNHKNDKSSIDIGKECLIRGNLMVLKHGGKIKIGNHCFLGDNSRIWSSVNVTIGDRVLISHNVNIHDNNSHSFDSNIRHQEFLSIIKYHTLLVGVEIGESEIIIGNDVWIGFNATILKGVTIGDGAIIGANTIITKNVEPYTVVVGNPHKVRYLK